MLCELYNLQHNPFSNVYEIHCFSDSPLLYLYLSEFCHAKDFCTELIYLMVIFYIVECGKGWYHINFNKRLISLKHHLGCHTLRNDQHYILGYFQLLYSDTS
ncbi:hypothetical protein GUJ93_ZPchr0012g18867 [Zizania palustris]|uniref:Uncharacterized protein n=1 Tax=Zizania palustris TaxID=103762 RepID=A0A8J6BYS8_ZIZPA|nr:hypothetical protein GUJ93_ZPchr0012g18867 [Zizania palustris]